MVDTNPQIVMAMVIVMVMVMEMVVVVVVVVVVQEGKERIEGVSSLRGIDSVPGKMYREQVQFVQEDTICRILSNGGVYSDCDV